MYSFPSGHASFTFAGLMIGLWFIFQCVPFSSDVKTIWHFRMWRMFPMFVFLGIATVVACSRTIDYWHNFDDIIGGALIGLSCAFFAIYVNTHIRPNIEPPTPMVEAI